MHCALLVIAPTMGAITSKAQADALQAQIDKALAADVG